MFVCNSSLLLIRLILLFLLCFLPCLLLYVAYTYTLFRPRHLAASHKQTDPKIQREQDEVEHTVQIFRFSFLLSFFGRFLWVGRWLGWRKERAKRTSKRIQKQQFSARSSTEHQATFLRLFSVAVCLSSHSLFYFIFLFFNVLITVYIRKTTHITINFVLRCRCVVEERWRAKRIFIQCPLAISR